MGVPPINPLGDYAATFDLFYQFVKLQIGNLQADQYIQIKAIAEPFDASLSYKWFSFYTYLLKVDETLKPVPLTDTMAASNVLLSDEYERFINIALQFVERQELDPTIIEQINQKSILRGNIRDSLKALVKEDTNDWKDYATARGFQVGDSAAYAQWSFTQGNGAEIDAKTKQLLQVEGDLAQLRSQQYKDADSKEIKDLYDQIVSPGSRIRYPRVADTEYPNGKDFNIGYLASLPTGSTALFDDRRVMFPQVSLQAILGSSIGAFTEHITKSSQASQSMSSDWHAGGSVSYLWFSASADAHSQTQIQQDFSTTTDVTISCKALMMIPYTADPWFKASAFNNGIISKNAGSFARFLGAGGSLLYYPKALIVMRGFKVTFKNRNNWKYDYAHTFSANGSGNLSVFGIGFGGSYSQTQHDETHQVQQNGDELSFVDGDNTLRVIGFIAQKNNAISKAISAPLMAAWEQVVKLHAVDEKA